MRTVGFERPLYILPFDHRGSFQTKMFGWTGELTAEQTAQIAAAKRVIDVENAWNADKYVWSEYAQCEDSVIVT